MFQDSPVSKKLLDYATVKFGAPIAFIFLLKCCAVVSCKLEWPRFSLMHFAPSRAFKTFTSNEVMFVFTEEFWIDLRSDFTVNSLRRYKGRLPLGVCLLVNDATLLLASKIQRFKDRIINGFSELLSDGKYVYQNFHEKFTLECSVTTIWNITSEAHSNYKDRLFALTFSQRFLTVHYAPTKKERDEWVEKEEAATKIPFKGKITVEDISPKVEIPSKYLSIVKHLAQEFSYLTLNSQVACADLIKGLLRAHASLNKRSQVCVDDIKVILMVRPYLVSQLSPYEGLVVKYRAQGLSIRKIAKKLEKPITTSKSSGSSTKLCSEAFSIHSHPRNWMTLISQKGE